jgi:hypothetical protein
VGQKSFWIFVLHLKTYKRRVQKNEKILCFALSHRRGSNTSYASIVSISNLVLITTKSEVIRCLSVLPWLQKFKRHLVGISQHCSSFGYDESNLDSKHPKKLSCFWLFSRMLIALNREERSESMMNISSWVLGA